jgi:hypothetical protein
MKPTTQQKMVAIGVSIFVSALIIILLAAFSISILDEYGFVLFMLVPLALGLISTLIYGYYQQRTFKESLAVSLYALLAVCIGLVVLKIEAILCVVMACPFVSVFMLIGTTIGYRIQRRNKGTVIRILSVNGLVIPLLMMLETSISHGTPEMLKVTTSITIDAPINEVWKNVIVFPPIEEPDEWLFKAGIAYPTSSEIVGEGIGSIRYCEFTTGKFVEPIVVWDEPNRLQFTVKEQPAPLSDMLVDEVPSSMYKYFASTKGEFALQRQGESATVLKGTTWYYHKIKPGIYWRLWSDFIIHSIHQRVLEHIKTVSESQRSNVRKDG